MTASSRNDSDESSMMYQPEVHEEEEEEEEEGASSGSQRDDVRDSDEFSSKRAVGATEGATKASDLLGPAQILRTEVTVLTASVRIK